MMRRLARVSGIWRSLPPRQPAVAWMLVAVLIVGVSTGISHGVHSGARGALIVFLAWAIVRELAPDRPVAAAIAPFAAVAFAIPVRVDLLACAGVLFLARIALRSTGRAPTLLDQLAMIGLAAWLATRPVGFPVAVVLAAIVFVDDRQWRSRLAGSAALAAALLVAIPEGTITARPAWDDPTRPESILLVLVAVTALLVALVPVPRALAVRDDRDHAPLQTARLRSSRVATVAALIAAIAWTGSDAVFALGAVSAAFVAVALGGLRLPGR